MFEKIKEICKILGIDKLILIFIVGLCSMIALLSFLTGKQNTPLAIMSEEIIEDVVESETGVKLDINNYEPEEKK